MYAQHKLVDGAYQTEENPLVWPVFEVLKHRPLHWKVHTLASELVNLGYVAELGGSQEMDMFKRNFLIMNALYQLQEMLYPEKWLQVEAMDIRLFFVNGHRQHVIDYHDPLREYYMNWANYDADESEVRRLLDEFWTRYKQHVGNDDQLNSTDISREKALQLFQLDDFASDHEIRKTWRKLALRWHPDREHGDASQFRILCEAWHVLR